MEINKILVIRFSSLGDIILLSPLFREAKKRYPGAQIDFLTSTTFRSVCANNPFISEILTFDRKNEASESKSIKKLIKKEKYDLILDAHHSIRSRLILTGCFGPFYFLKKNIATVDKRSWKRNLLLKTKINLLKKPISQRDAYLKLLEKLGGESIFDSSTALYPGEADKKNVERLISAGIESGQKLVAIGPGASFPGKCWPKERFLEVANKLSERQFKVVLLGGPDDSEPGWIESNCKYPLINLAGKLSYLETAEAVSKCALTLSNDSAIVHFSEAMGTPAISIFGPTSKEFGYGPYLPDSSLIDVDLPCRPCSRNGKGKCKIKNDRQCLKDISVDTVMKTAGLILR